MPAIGHTVRIRTVTANRRSAKGGICLTLGPGAIFRAMPGRLSAPFNRIALGNPIGAQIVSEIENLNVGEPQIL